MNEIIPSSTPSQTMSSRDLAEMYGKPHNDTLKKIRKLESAYVEVFGTEGNFSLSDYKDPTGRMLPEILLNKSQTLFVASRFDAVLHAKVQKRWEELELKERRPAIDPMAALNDPAAMRGLLLTYTEKVIALQATVSEQAPIVAAFDRIAKADGSICITDAAKVLQVQPKALFLWLQANHWIYRRAGGRGWIGYQDLILSGYLEHKVTVVTRGDGSRKTTEQVLVTPKGITKLSKKFVEEAA